MTSCDLEQIINAKYSFEKFAATYGVTVNYHADNGYLACKGFRDTIYNAIRK